MRQLRSLTLLETDIKSSTSSEVDVWTRLVLLNGLMPAPRVAVADVVVVAFRLLDRVVVVGAVTVEEGLVGAGDFDVGLGEVELLLLLLLFSEERLTGV